MKSIQMITCLVAAACASSLTRPTWANETPLVNMQLLSEGAMQKLGGYMPQKTTLSADAPASLLKKPAMDAPVFAEIKFGGKSYLIALDEPEGKDAKLYVDANGNGNLTDDPAPVWKKQMVNGPAGKQLTVYSGSLKLPLSAGGKQTLVNFGAYRFDKNDPQRATLKNVFLYYSDYAYEGDVAIGDAKYHAMLANDLADGDFRGTAAGDGRSGVRLLMDLNGDGKFDNRSESFDVRKPFNIKGTTWELADVTPGGSFKIQKSGKTVAEIVLPVSLGKGQAAIAFKAIKMDGSEVNFPTAYKGKLVLLDFWATWCGPCMAEVPELVKTYKAYHLKGFEILGISLDQPNTADKVKTVTADQGMTWPQVYDGKFWESRVGQMYSIDSIPHAFLIDGDSGKIVAEGDILRGENLAKTLATALAEKAKAGGK